jgi:hypothetical protein
MQICGRGFTLLPAICGEELFKQVGRLVVLQWSLPINDDMSCRPEGWTTCRSPLSTVGCRETYIVKKGTRCRILDGYLRTRLPRRWQSRMVPDHPFSKAFGELRGPASKSPERSMPT